MNKNTKKFVVTLLSVLMVLSFMPAMAFAEPAPANGHTWKVDKEKSVEATCETEGYSIWYCDEKDCNVTAATLENPTGHTYDGVNPVQYRVAEYLQAVIEEGATLEEVEALATALEGKCYLYAKHCKDCNKLEKINGAYVYYNVAGAPGQAENHTRPTTVPDCAASFECAFCGQEVVGAAGNHDYGNQYTNPWQNEVLNMCPAHVGDDLDGINVQARPCLNGCGAYEYRQNTAVAFRYNNRNYDAGTRLEVRNQNGYFRSQEALDAYLEAHVAHNVKPVDPQPTEDFDKYVLYNGKYYDATTVTDPADCTHAGSKKLVCPDCGMDVGNTVVIPATGHKMDGKLVSPATCTERGYERTVCSVCGALGTLKYTTDAPLGHDYKVTVISEPNCEYDGLTLIDCTRCFGRRIAGQTQRIATVEGKFFFTGFTGELYKQGAVSPYADCIEIKDWHHGAHKWGAYEDYKPATCEDAAVQARKCAVCNSFDHAHTKAVGKANGHDIKSYTVAPTCGEEGYSYDTCDVCKLYINHETKKKNNLDPDDDRTNFIDRYDIKPPVKAAGTPCEFEWGDLDENTEAEICKNCGAVKPGTETPKTEEKKAKEAAEAAKPVISAAADITNDTANYKASSIKAIEEAKKNLDTAIYAGSADQIRQATAELQAAIDAAAKKDANTMKAKGKTVKANAKKKTTFSKAKAFKISGAKGAVTFKKKSGNKKVTVSKAGKVTVKKGLKKGKTYKIKVTVKAAGNGDYLAKSQVVTLKVKVK